MVEDATSNALAKLLKACDVYYYSIPLACKPAADTMLIAAIEEAKREQDKAQRKERKKRDL